MSNKNQVISLPESCPFMCLDNCIVYPKQNLTLNIFEEKYKKMLKHVLENDRIFGISNFKFKSSEERIASVGFVQVCKVNKDGTAILQLQGLSKIIIEDYKINEYHQVKISPIDIIDLGSQEKENLKIKIIKIYDLLNQKGFLFDKSFIDYTKKFDNTDNFLDIFVRLISSDPFFIDNIFRTINTKNKFNIILDYLKEEYQINHIN